MSRAPLRTIPARGSRLTRRGGGEAPLESLAAEFALLAQRRGRVTRQLELLERQRVAASATLRLVENRLGVLSRTIHAPVAEPMPLPQPMDLPPPPPRFLQGRATRYGAQAEAPTMPARAAPPAPPPAPALRPAADAPAASPRTTPRWKRGLVLEY